MDVAHCMVGSDYAQFARLSGHNLIGLASVVIAFKSEYARSKWRRSEGFAAIQLALPGL